MRLVSLSTVGQLPADAAASYERMRLHALRDGVDLRPTSAADAHRTRAQQERVFFERYVLWNTGTGDRRVYQGRSYWRRPGVASAAVPGTSNHGLEDPAALDLTGLGGLDGKGYRWLEQHGAEYGWVNPEWAKNPKGGATRELWHWEYSRTRDQHLNAGGGGSTVAPAPAPPTSEEDDMTPEQSAKLDYIFNAIAPGESGVRSTGHVLVQLTRIENAVGAVSKAVTGVATSVKDVATAVGKIPAAVWGYRNAALEKVDDAYAKLRKAASK